MRSASSFGLLCVAAVALYAGCSASAGDGHGFSTEGSGGASSGVTSSTGVGGAFTTSSATTSSGSSGGDCTEAAKLVYVLSAENDLYSFQPANKVFTKIGPLQCNTAMVPNSMAVDRDAIAWVNYVESDGFGDTAGAVFRVDTKDASCQPTNIHLPATWYRLGMGFSVDQANGTAETLYVTGTGAMLGQGNSPGLGKIDLKSMQLQPIGQFTGNLAGQSGELTGTGDARLFAFFTSSPVNVAEIDKGSAKVLNQKPLPSVEVPAAWAFSFWGGDFYLYTAPDPNLNPGRSTNVTHYSPGNGNVDTAYMTNIGFMIVGAGVSTCAPVEPPK
jgi:hypothetical protein